MANLDEVSKQAKANLVQSKRWERRSNIALILVVLCFIGTGIAIWQTRGVQKDINKVKDGVAVSCVQNKNDNACRKLWSRIVSSLKESQRRELIQLLRQEGIAKKTAAPNQEQVFSPPKNVEVVSPPQSDNNTSPNVETEPQQIIKPPDIVITPPVTTVPELPVVPPEQIQEIIGQVQGTTSMLCDQLQQTFNSLGVQVNLNCQ